MGNCLKSEKVKKERSTMETGVKEVKCVKDVKNNSKGVRVKMVLTKEELQWLMLQLKNKSESGTTRIEDVLGEIEKARNGVALEQGWKPSLSSISERSEIPEVHEIDRL